MTIGQDIGSHAYRNGKYQEAIEACETSRRLNEQQNIAVLTAANHAIEAMAHQKLGNSEKAIQSIAAAENEFDNNLPALGVVSLSGFWHDWLIARILYQEATNSNR